MSLTCEKKNSRGLFMPPAGKINFHTGIFFTSWASGRPAGPRTSRLNFTDTKSLALSKQCTQSSEKNFKLLFDTVSGAGFPAILSGEWQGDPVGFRVASTGTNYRTGRWGLAGSKGGSHQCLVLLRRQNCHITQLRQLFYAPDAQQAGSIFAPDSIPVPSPFLSCILKRRVPNQTSAPFSSPLRCPHNESGNNRPPSPIAAICFCPNLRFVITPPLHHMIPGQGICFCMQADQTVIYRGRW